MKIIYKYVIKSRNNENRDDKWIGTKHIRINSPWINHPVTYWKWTTEEIQGEIQSKTGSIVAVDYP